MSLQKNIESLHCDNVAPDIMGESDLDSCTLVFMNEVILHRLFEFLPFEDFKNSRLVCSKWKRIGEASFKKRVQICFDFLNDVDGGKLEYPTSGDLTTFFENSQEEFPFTALRLSNSVPWSTRALKKYFSTEGQFITHLTLSNVRLIADDFEENRNFLAKINLGIILGNHVQLKVLNILRHHENFENTTHFSLSLKVLSTISEIYLEGCTIDFTDLKIIAPVHFKLVDVTFLQNDVIVENVLLNDFLDFTVMKRMVIFKCSSASEFHQTIKLDLGGSASLDHLTLSGVNVLNLEKSSWSTDLCCLAETPFVKRTDMNFKQLRFSQSLCNLYYLPQTCGNLYLGYETEFSENDTWDFFLPNVKYLHLNTYKMTVPLLSKVISPFNNLVELMLGYVSCIDNKINLNCFPKTLKRLTLLSVGFEFEGVDAKALDLLILKYTTIKFVEKILKHFISNVIIVFAYKLRTKCGKRFLKTLAKNSSHKMILGLLDSDNSSRFDKPFSITFPTPQKEEEFYSFVNGKGDAVKCKSYEEAEKFSLDGQSTPA